MRSLAARARRASRRRVDVALAVALGGALAVEALVAEAGPWWSALVCAVAVAVPLVWRRAAPARMVALALAGAVGGAALGTDVPALGSALAFLAVLGLTLGRHADGRPLRLGAAAVVVGVVAVTAIRGDPLAEAGFPLVVAAAAGAVGVALHARARLARALAERTEELEAEREARARDAELDERRRIARELHDLVAHSVSVMVVQAGGARATLDRDPDRALEALAAVEGTGRTALLELRRLLGLLRPEGEDAARAPQPGLAGLDDLVDRARAAGLPVELDVRGEPGPLPPGIDLAAYRVVQEALTNTLKHAGPAHARVVVRWTPAALELVVSDTGRGPRGASAEHGHGLLGMRERVAVYAGELHAGRRRGGGFEIRVRLPRAGQPAGV